MNEFILTRNRLVLCAAGVWAFFMLLSASQINTFQILNILGFAVLVLLPGTLTVAALRLRGMPIWGYIGMVVGFSLLELMLASLLANTMLPHIGITRPLDAKLLLATLSVLIIVLAAFAWVRVQPIRIAFELPKSRDALFAFAPLIFVGMSIFGAIRLNNGATGTLTLLMLVGIAAYMAALIYYAEEVGEWVVPTAFFCMSLALLLMTSLRGWYTTGHDIQNEYKVFELTKNNSHWVMAYYRDAYNACMSITILPTIFSRLLKIADPYIYKIYFQLVFALTASILYLTIRKYVSATLALLSTFYFIAFPTFFGDMPFINRQEIAFVFLALMIYVLFSEQLSVLMRRSLFIIFGVGMILSHYSTTYTVLGVLIFLVCMQPVVVSLGPRLSKLRWFSDSAVEALGREHYVYTPLITWWVAISLVLVTFVWTGLVTDTAAGSIVKVVQETILAVSGNAKEDSQSSDVNASLLSYGRIDYKALFNGYEKNVIEPARAKAAPGTYFDSSIYLRYPIHFAPDETVPLTFLGKALTNAHVDVANANYIFHQAAAKLLQLLIGIGFVILLYSSRFIKKKINTEFVLLSTGSLILLVAIVLLPVLSVQYGLLRAFQQSLIFLGIFLVVGSFALTIKFNKKVQLFLVSAFVLMFFLSESGALTQLFGGYDPLLNLNNDGLYYDIYYAHKSEEAGISWLNSQVIENTDTIQVTTQSDYYSSGKLKSITSLNPVNDIFPGLIRKGTYIFLGYTTVHKQRATITYNGTQVTYTYPMQFLDDNKNLFYNNGDVKIYK